MFRAIRTAILTLRFDRAEAYFLGPAGIYREYGG